MCRCDERLKLLFIMNIRKRELKTRPIYECRCDERLKTKSEKSFFYYYESTKRNLKTKYIELKRRRTYVCRCYERLQTKTKEFTCLSYTELVLELEHLKIETRLITEMFTNVMGDCEN